MPSGAGKRQHTASVSNHTEACRGSDIECHAYQTLTHSGDGLVLALVAALYLYFSFRIV